MLRCNGGILLHYTKKGNKIIPVSFHDQEDSAMTTFLEYFAIMDFLILCGIAALVLCSLYDQKKTH